MNRFDLEQQITSAWSGTEDDIENILHAHFDSPDTGLTEDELMNSLTGLKQAHNLRMQKLFDVFEQIIKDKSFEPATEEEITKIKNDYYMGSLQ